MWLDENKAHYGTYRCMDAASHSQLSAPDLRFSTNKMLIPVQ